MASPNSNSNADHLSGALDDARVRGVSTRKPPGPPGTSNELSEPLIVESMPPIPKAHTVHDNDQNPASRRSRSTFDVSAAPDPPRHSVGMRVLLVLLQFVLLGGYTVLCMFVGLLIMLSHYWGLEGSRDTELPAARWRFVRACAVLAGIVGPVVAGLCFLWGVATAIWQKLPRPWLMRVTLNTAPALAHGVFVLMPFTVAVMETKKGYRKYSRKLLL